MNDSIRQRIERQIVKRTGRPLSKGSSRLLFPDSSSSDKAGIHHFGSYWLFIRADGSITVRPGDWISKYSAAIHRGDTRHIHEYGRKVNGVLKPLGDPNRILAGETIYHLPTARAAVKRKAPPRRRRIDENDVRRTAQKYQRLAKDRNTAVERFVREVESTAAAELGRLGADALVFSLSGGGGIGIGGGIGFELVYSPTFRWVWYFQMGAGVLTPGAGAVLAAGVIFNLKRKQDYTGDFIEVALSATTPTGPLYVSGSATPQDVLDFISSGALTQACAFKVGATTPGFQASVLWQFYVLLERTPPRVYQAPPA